VPPVQVSRPTQERFDEALAVLQAADVAVYGDTDWTELELRDEWAKLDLARDAWLVELDGRVAGVAHLADRVGGRFISDGYVHPELRGRGVGTVVLALVEERARELEPSWPAGERIVLESAHLVGDETAAALHEARGFGFVRRFFRMVVDVTEPPPEPVWPEGAVVRPFDPERDLPELHDAHEEAFAREWGHVARDLGAWREQLVGRPRFDPDLVTVVWDGDRAVGFALGYPKTMGDWGWIRNLGVRESWRRRGLGLALLHESFRRFRATGETTVALGVDSENPTGATRLYERAGMRVLWRADVWQKELRPGA
jgi:mycothiol synthase